MEPLRRGLSQEEQEMLWEVVSGLGQFQKDAFRLIGIALLLGATMGSVVTAFVLRGAP